MTRETELHIFLEDHAVDGLIFESCLKEASGRFDLTRAEVERWALQSSLLPARYQRNRASISLSEQLQLFSSRVSIIGCGGLGGNIVEQLTRLGVGEIHVIDDDVFEEHNLNRQLYATLDVLGTSKAEVAALRGKEINPAITIVPIKERFTGDNGDRILSGADVVIDAVDNLDTRRHLVHCCSQLGIPMVHGAIAGWYGQVSTIYPGDTTLDKLYPEQAVRGIEQQLGNPAFTPAVIASLQAAEACKVLLKRQGQLRNRILYIDLLDMETEELPV